MAPSFVAAKGGPLRGSQGHWLTHRREQDFEGAGTESGRGACSAQRDLVHMTAEKGSKFTFDALAWQGGPAGTQNLPEQAPDAVQARVCHRRYLEDLHSIDVSASLCASHLLPSERALLIPQRAGAFFSGEYVKHFAPETSLCFFVDGRFDRTDECPRALAMRATFPVLEAAWSWLPPHTRAFGLWDELLTLRLWQAELDSRSPAFPQRSSESEQVVLYTDGSCLHPKDPQCRVASFAVLQALPDGQLGAVHSGPLPGSHQTPYRAELFAVVVAFSAYTKPLVFSDCLGVVRRCRKIIHSKQQGLPIALPSTNTDLWTMFLQQLEQVDISQAGVQWIPGHQDWRTCAGSARIHAWFNQWADQVAKQAFQSHRARLFLTHVQA
eukprot:Skav234520  [mRNA]  locus=scaffold2407:20176:21504:- [translate_table: standard]